MFGYVIANLEGLTQAQKDRYKGCYCGLCRVLKPVSYTHLRAHET